MDQELPSKSPRKNGRFWTTVLTVGAFLAHWVWPSVWPVAQKVAVEVSTKGLVSAIDDWRKGPVNSAETTGSIERNPSAGTDRLRKTEAYALCLERREMERQQAVGRIEAAREEHSRCKAAFRPRFFSSETAAEHCRTHENVVRALEADHRQAKPRLCRRPN